MTSAARTRDLLTAPNWPALIDQYGKGALLNAGASFGHTARACRWRTVFLASPYAERVTTEGAYDRLAALNLDTITARWARGLAVDGVTVVSPVLQIGAMVHADLEGDLDPLDSAFWAHWARPLLRNCEAVIVPPIEGWDRSRGVWCAVNDAVQRNIPVYLLEGWT